MHFPRDSGAQGPCKAACCCTLRFQLYGGMRSFTAWSYGDSKDFATPTGHLRWRCKYGTVLVACAKGVSRI